MVLAAIAAATLSAGFSCRKKQPPPPPEEPELITTVRLVFTDSVTGASKQYSFVDPDGDGGATPFYGPDRATQTDSVIVLKAQTVYLAQLVLLDETKTPAVDISEEVRRLGAEHMVFYNHGANTVVSGSQPYTVKLAGSGVEIRYADLDGSSPPLPVGLQTRWRTGDTSSVRQSIAVTLRHQPDGKNGTYDPGETDVSVSFRLDVK